MSFAEYVVHGWALCRIRPGTKSPIGDNWQYRESAIRAPEIAAGGMAAGLCHAWSGTCAVDIDNWDVAAKYLRENGVDLQALFSAEDAVQITSGRQGRGKLLYALPNPLPSVHLAPYKGPGKKDPSKQVTYHGIELRCATRGGLTVQDVLPPTIHPDTGNSYAWVYGDPIMGHWSNLPPLPAALHALWTAQRDPVEQTPQHETKTPRGATLDEIQALLDAKDPEDCAYDDWLDVGLILHHELGGSAQGYALWLAWSSRCSKHDVTTMPVKWQSFGQSPGPYKTIGSLIRERVASPEEFGTVPEPDPDEIEDSGATRDIDAILKPRVVYLLDQERYYHKPLAKVRKGYLSGLDDVGAQALKPVAFDVLYTPYMPLKETTSTGKDGSKRTSVAPEDPRKCIKQSRRIEKVNGIGFHPGAGRVFTEEDGARMYNEYFLVEVQPLRPKPHELDAWAFLCSRIEDDIFRSWLLRFFAHMIAKPGVKIQSAPLLVSDTQGTGKTTWMQTIPQLLLGERWVNEISSEQVAKSFNSYLARTWWVTIEELKTDGPRMDRIAIANKMKPWITSKTIPVEFKGLDVYKIYNRVQVGASSNFRDSMQLDNSDRRWGVARVTEHAMTEAEKAGLYTDFLNTPRAPGVVRWLIQQQDLTGFSPAALPPSTDAKRTMIDVGYGPWETKVAESMADGDSPFDRDIFALEDVQHVLRSMNVELSRKRVGMLLGKAPFHATQKSTGTKLLYCWRNCKLWEQHPISAWESHRETAARPAGVWSAKIPVAIRGAAGQDEGAENPEFTDLLGVI